ncbi:MAG: hypothetical protein Q8L76_11035, partial [Cypionkella sp.]|nr:hypothetical protein [Cypionkella sp.]
IIQAVHRRMVQDRDKALELLGLAPGVRSDSTSTRTTRKPRPCEKVSVSTSITLCPGLRQR